MVNFILGSFYAFPIFSAAWLCQQTSWYRNWCGVQRPASVVHPSLVSIISELMAWISFKFQLLVVLHNTPGCCLDFWKKSFSDYFMTYFFFFFVNIGPYESKRFKTLLLLQITTKIFKPFLNFLPNGPHKTTFGIFDILKIEILTIYFFVFVNMGSNRGKTIQNALPPTNLSLKFSNFSWIFYSIVLTYLRLEFLKFWKLKS